MARLVRLASKQSIPGNCTSEWDLMEGDFDC